MAQPNSAKSYAVIRNVAEKLAQRLPTVTVAQGTDTTTAANPQVQVGVAVGSWSTGNNYAVLRAQAVPQIFTDGLGNTLQGFAPTYLDCAVEASATSGVAASQLLLLAPVIAEATRQGCILRLYTTANTVQPVFDGSTAITLIATLSPETQWQTAAS